MTKFKKAIALLLALSMVMMSGIFAFADGEALPQDGSASVIETKETVPTENTVSAENTVLAENQQPEETAKTSDEQEAADETQETQQPVNDTKGENVPVDESTKSDDVRKNEGEGTNATQTEQNSVPNYVSTKVFLRYTNEVPANILQSFAQEGFGPAGTSSSPYFTVEVDLNKIEALCGQGSIKKYTSGEYVYYSAQETLNPGQAVTKADAVSCWNAVLQAVSETDKSKFIEYFGVSGVAGTPNFIGYVFKLETDGWHIDGILDVKPGYVTEFYLNGEIKKTDVASAAMPINTAKGNIEEMLGADSGTIKWNDNGMGGTYEMGDDIYQFTIQPDGDYSASDENVRYVTKIQDAYYLARIYVTTEKTGQKPAPEPTPVIPPTNGPVEPKDPADPADPKDPIDPLPLPPNDPLIPVTPPAIPEPVNPQPLPPDDPLIPVTPPAIPEPVNPQPLPEPQPLPSDDPLIEEPDEPTVEPQPLPPDDPLIEEPDEPTVNPQPLPEDEYLTASANMERTEDPDQPKTGDEAPLMALTGLFLVSAGALGAIYIKRKKED